MANLNFKSKEMECKIVFYGPGRGGKTTNLEYIFKTYQKQTTGEMVSINTKGDRTLFFDFLPLKLGKIRGYNVRVQLYTVPGQVRYNSTRKVVLRGVDGLVFVADSLLLRREHNIMSLNNLQENLKSYGLKISEIPLVIQYNKRDLEKEGIRLLSVESMEQDMNRQLQAPSFSASASNGQGVGATLKECLKLTLESLQNKLE
ncbi:MAG: GTPase domain-containing protein [Deltaproteobacteria bacterium]|nr:GTPase domain-containing protein [Deltaproteobacteria bacterium]